MPAAMKTSPTTSPFPRVVEVVALNTTAAVERVADRPRPFAVQVRDDEQRHADPDQEAVGGRAEPAPWSSRKIVAIALAGTVKSPITLIAKPKPTPTTAQSQNAQSPQAAERAAGGRWGVRRLALVADRVS